MKEQIKTVKNFIESKLKEKGSVFLGQAYQVKSKAEIGKLLVAAKKNYYDATHVCFAYRLLGDAFHYSDDGEPNGTAGVRILNAIDHFDLNNTLVLVIRYYGGIKLGVGPLGRAYYNTAFELLQGIETEIQKFYTKVRIVFDYNLTSPVHHILKQYSAINLANKFNDCPAIECDIDSGMVEKMFDELKQISSGKIVSETIEERILIPKN